jgi:hypothetical protein
MRPPNQQFIDTSTHCERHNQPIIAWPEDCGQYTAYAFPLIELNAEGVAEKWDLIHVDDIEAGETIKTRPGRAYARFPSYDGSVYLATFEPRDADAQQKCEDYGDTTEAYAKGYSDAAADYESVVKNASAAYDAAFDEGYGVGEQDGWARSQVGWLDGWAAGRKVLRAEEDPVPPVTYDKFTGGPGDWTITPYVPGESAQEEEEVEFELQEYWMPSPPSVDTTNTMPKEESEMNMDNETCTPCERLKYAVKALEAAEQREFANTLLRPMAEMIGQDAIDIVDEMDTLFARSEDLFTALSLVEDEDEKDTLLRSGDYILADSLDLEDRLSAKIAEIS